MVFWVGGWGGWGGRGGGGSWWGRRVGEFVHAGNNRCRFARAAAANPGRLFVSTALLLPWALEEDHTTRHSD